MDVLFALVRTPEKTKHMSTNPPGVKLHVDLYRWFWPIPRGLEGQAIFQLRQSPMGSPKFDQADSGPKRALRTWIWGILHVAGADCGCGADVIVPGAIRRIASCTVTSAPDDGDRPWPAGSSIRRIRARQRVLIARNWAMLRCSGADRGCGADVIVPDAIRRIAWGTATPAPQPRPAPEQRSIAQIRAMSAFFRAQIRLM